MGFRLVPTSMTLNAVITLILRFFSDRIRRIFWPIISQWLKTYNVRKILSSSSSLLLLAKTITHPAAWSLCDSWASCWQADGKRFSEFQLLSPMWKWNVTSKTMKLCPKLSYQPRTIYVSAKHAKTFLTFYNVTDTSITINYQLHV